MRNLSPQSRQLVRSVLLGIVIGVGISLVFSAGFVARDLLGPGFVRASAQGEDTGGYPLLDEVQVLLDDHYLREQPDSTQRQYAAIRGMLGVLGDRYTFFIDPPVAQSESDVLAGTYGGIGVLVERNEAGELVLYPFPDGPAARAGILDGAVLQSINDAPIDVTLPQDQIDQLLRGEVKEDSGVDLTVLQGENREEFTAFVPFEVINVPSVVWRVLAEDERVGYVQIMRFTARTPEELDEGLQVLRDADIDALVVDLRNNSGGLLQESINVADEFVDEGVIVYERDNEGEQPFYATEGGLATDLPLAVLVNQGTASGAELVAGVLQDMDRGPVIGQLTYGKGTVQQIFGLSDGSSLHVTSAEWFTPERQALSEHGLVPDIEMIPDINGRDVELGEAVRQLQATLVEEAA